VLYLHGALHLFVPHTGAHAGKTLKRESTPASLLSGLLTELEAPLVVAEGTASEKKSNIANSDYLSFAYETFSKYRGPLVIFGSELGESDSHLVEAIRPAAGRRLAVSVRGTAAEQRWTMAQFEMFFAGAPISYFHAETHPLGAIELRVNVQGA
jgi:hypothetical protein